MPVHKSIVDNVCHMKIVGEMKIYDVIQYKKEILESMESYISLNLELEELEDLDAAGLQLLILLKKESDKKQIPLNLASISMPVQKLLDLYCLTEWFQNN